MSTFFCTKHQRPKPFASLQEYNAHVERKHPPLEKHVYEQVAKLFCAAGCKVIRFSQQRASRQTPGVPDLYVFPPARVIWVAKKEGPINIQQPFWMEVKRPGGKQSPDQVAFQQDCEARGVTYLLGGVEEAIAHLRLLGLVR